MPISPEPFTQPDDSLFRMKFLQAPGRVDLGDQQTKGIGTDIKPC
jgi:hypothetical protein